jgi:alpha-ribazole phosphatase
MTRSSSPKVTRVFLVRHGEAEVSVQGRCCGQLDPILSPKGAEQMRGAVALLSRVRVDAVYASPSRRAVESALALQPAGDVRIEPSFQEMNFGRLEGLLYEEAAQRYPDVYEKWMKQPHLVEFPGGETFQIMRRRVVGAWKRLLRRHAGQTVVVVAHGGVNRIVLAEGLRLRARHVFRLAQDYGAVSLIEYRGRTPTVRLLNASPFALGRIAC